MLQELRNKDEVAAFLWKSAFLHVYEIGDLDDFYWPHTRWFGWVQEGELRAVFLLYSVDSECPTFLAFEEDAPQASHQLARKMIPLLPDHLHAHLSFHLEELFREKYLFESKKLDLRMGIRPEGLQEPFPVTGVQLIQLSGGDLGKVKSLYERAYPGNWFEPRMLETGHYLGLEKGSELLGVAGVHVYSPRHRIAALGNIATEPSWRDRGVGTFLTFKLCRKLFETVDLIGLNVRSGNEAAIRCYRKLGFVEQCRFSEVELVRPEDS